jgi:hypothetical protein
MTLQPDQSERNPVNIEERLKEEGSRAIANNSVRNFLNQYSQDEQLWNWLNSRNIDMRLFLGIAKELNNAETEQRLNAGRQLIIQYYRIAERVEEEEPRPAFLTKLDQLRASVGIYPDESAAPAIKDILVQSDPDLLLDESHEALLYYGLSIAHEIPDFDEVVSPLISDHPTFFGELALLSMLAQTYGPSFIKLLSESCLRSQLPDECAKLIEYVAALPRDEHESDQEFCQRASAWYDENKSRLTLDKSALYPAPPFRPLFKTDALQ